MFTLNPLEVGNPVMLGIMEEKNDKNFSAMIDFIINGTDDGCMDTAADMKMAMRDYDVKAEWLSPSQLNILNSLIKEH